MKIGRNAPCPCGSGKKYKNCCLAKSRSSVTVQQKLLAAAVVLIVVAGLIAVVVAFRSDGPSTGSGLVWSEEHQHWH